MKKLMLGMMVAAMAGSGGALTFKRIAFDGRQLLATTDKPARFEVISKQGVVGKGEGTSFAFDRPTGDHVYLRLKAYATDASEEILFSQPFMLDA